MATVEFQPLQPDLVKSISEDEEDDEERSVGQKDEFVNHSALAYLLRYETMVRQQEAENLASLAHVRPILDRIEELGADDDPEEPRRVAIDDDAIMQREVSFRLLQRALERLESDAMSSEAMTTDRQFMLVLRSLTQNLETTSTEAKDQTLTWAEIYQCYKSIVAGMQTLQHLPPSSQARMRARDRSLSMLTLFQPPSTKLLGEDALRNSDNILTEESSEPTKGRGILYLLCFTTFMIVATFVAAMLMDPKLAQIISLPQRADSAPVVFPPVDAPAPIESVGIVAETPTTTSRRKARPATSLVVRLTGVASAPFLVKSLVLLPTPLQSLGVLTIGGLSVVASVSQTVRTFVEHRATMKAE